MFLKHDAVLPNGHETTKYMVITATGKRYHKAEAYACVTMVATARPIHEMKRNHPSLLRELQQHNVYLRSTAFQTTETVEIGFFLGLHPSLTNLDWRTQQIRKALGHEDVVPHFQLYRRKLTEGDNSTSCIVIRCQKQEVQALQSLLMQEQNTALGMGVDFIPYHLASVWKHT